MISFHLSLIYFSAYTGMLLCVYDIFQYTPEIFFLLNFICWFSSVIVSLIHDACLMKIMYAAVHEIRSYIRFLVSFCSSFLFYASAFSGFGNLIWNLCLQGQLLQFLFPFIFKADEFYLSAALFSCRFASVNTFSISELPDSLCCLWCPYFSSFGW